jgi:hypothetical protein
MELREDNLTGLYLVIQFNLKDTDGRFGQWKIILLESKDMN